MEKRAILIAGGTPPKKETIKKYIKKNDFIICADSGYDTAISLSLIPDIIIGDMDSVKSRDIDLEKIIYPSKKDKTDSEIILEYAREKGFNKLFLFGFLGTRFDHTIANLSIVFDYSDLDILIVDDYNEIKILDKENKIKGKKGDIVSIIPFGEDILKITTKGLEYPLKNEKQIYYAVSEQKINIYNN